MGEFIKLSTSPLPPLFYILTVTSGELSRKQTGSTNRLKATKHILTLDCTVQDAWPSQGRWTSTATFGLGHTETHTPGELRRNPTIRVMSGIIMIIKIIIMDGTRYHLVLMVKASSCREKTMLWPIMMWKLICFSGRLLMGPGRRVWTWDWMGYGIIRGCFDLMRR